MHRFPNLPYLDALERILIQITILSNAENNCKKIIEIVWMAAAGVFSGIKKALFECMSMDDKNTFSGRDWHKMCQSGCKLLANMMIIKYSGHRHCKVGEFCRTCYRKTRQMWFFLLFFYCVYLHGRHLYVYSMTFRLPGHEPPPNDFGAGINLHLVFFWHASMAVCSSEYWWYVCLLVGSVRARIWCWSSTVVPLSAFHAERLVGVREKKMSIE